MRPGFIDGLVLAAFTTDDSDGASVRGGLAPGLARALEERLQALAGLERAERRAQVGTLADRLRPVRGNASLPARAAAILATEVPLELGRAWAAGAPKVRRGFRVSPPLKATLRRLALPSSPGAQSAERAAAATDDERLARWAPHLDADIERVRGALVLGARGDEAGDDRSRAWRRVGAELAEIEDAAWRE